MPIRFAYFDVGGTLIDPKPSVGHVYAEAGAPHGLEASAEALDQAFRACWQPHVEQVGKVSMTLARTEEENVDWWRRLVFRVLDRVGFHGDREAVFRSFFAAFESPEVWHIYPDALPTLEALRDRGIPLGVLSNWDHRLETLLDRLDLARYFDPILISCHEGMEKPDVRFFDLAAERAGVRPSEILYVGDHAHIDVDPGRDAGFEAYLIDRSEQSSHPHRIDSLLDLVDALD